MQKRGIGNLHMDVILCKIFVIKTNIGWFCTKHIWWRGWVTGRSFARNGNCASNQDYKQRREQDLSLTKIESGPVCWQLSSNMHGAQTLCNLQAGDWLQFSTTQWSVISPSWSGSSLHLCVLSHPCGQAYLRIVYLQCTHWGILAHWGSPPSGSPCAIWHPAPAWRQSWCCGENRSQRKGEEKEFRIGFMHSRQMLGQSSKNNLQGHIREEFRDHLRMRRTSCSIKARQAILYHHAARDNFNLALKYKYPSRKKVWNRFETKIPLSWPNDTLGCDAPLLLDWDLILEANLNS